MKKVFLFILLLHSIFLLTGCETNSKANVPSDFLFIMDVKSAGYFEGCPVHVNIHIDANGDGTYETYDTDCAIEYDLHHMVTYPRNRVIDKGQFRLSATQLEELWKSINDNHFFNLTDDYRMAMGSSFAFIMVEVDGQRYSVDNTGMEVPEIRAIVETTDSMIPEGVRLQYGEGFLP